MKAFFTAGFILVVMYAFPQSQHSWAEEKKFGEYLLENHFHKDCLTLFRGLHTNRSALSANQSDSTSFFIARCYEAMNKEDSMYKYLKYIYSDGPLHNYASARASLYLAKLGNYESAKSEVMSINQSADTSGTLKMFFLASIALLNHDSMEFHLQSKNMTPGSNLEEEENVLYEQATVIGSVKRKSPALAGALSAVVPGLGKVYGGKPLQGLTTLFPLTALAVQAAEAYHKGGIRDARFILYGSLFSLFYVGNVWGSVLSVGIKKREQYNESDQKVLSAMRLALSRTF